MLILPQLKEEIKEDSSCQGKYFVIIDILNIDSNLEIYIYILDNSPLINKMNYQMLVVHTKQ